MPVSINCPHCGSLCQVSEQYFGALVNCGRCRQPFKVSGAPPPPAPPPPAPPPAAIPIGAAGAVQKAPGLAEGLRGVVRSLMPFSKVQGTPAQVAPAPPPASSQPEEEEEEIALDFGPGVAALLEEREKPAPVPAPAIRGPAPAEIPRLAGVLRLDIGAATSTGMVRKRNEDSFLVQQLTFSNLDRRREIALVVVADGMGGHDAGDRASHLTIQALGNSLAPLLAGALGGQVKEMTPPLLAQTIDQAIRTANQVVHRQAQSDPGCRGMGCTAAVVLIWDGQAMIGHVGDCRVYGHRAGKLNQLTRDQTLVERMLKLGQLTPQEAANHPARNEVAQAVGRQPDVEPAAYQLKLVAGDWLIVACDGLHAHVDAKTLESSLRDPNQSAAFLAPHLVDLANKGGGSDNCTVVAIHCY